MFKFHLFGQKIIILKLLLFCTINQSFSYTLQTQSGKANSDVSSDETFDNEIRVDLKLFTKYVLEKMNLSVDPCDDFYEYVCGNYDSKNKIDYLVGKKSHNSISIIESIALEIYNSTKSPLEDSKFKDLLKTFLVSCITTLDLWNESPNKKLPKVSNIQQFLDYSKQLGGFPIIDIDWSTKNFNLEKSLYIMSLYNMDSFFNLKEISNRTIPILDNSQITIGSKDNFLIDDNLNFYRNYIIETLQLLNAKEDDAAKLADEIIDIESRLTGIEDDGRIEFKTMEELIKDYPKFDWKFYFEITFNTKLSDDSKVGFKHADNSLNVTYDIVTSVEKKTIANYLNWILLHNSMEFLGDPFSAKKDDLSRKLEEIKISNYCKEQAMNELDLAVAYYDLENINENIKNKITEIYNDVKDAFKENLLSYDWLDDESKLLVGQKLDNMTILLGYPDFIFNKTAVEEYYSDLELNEDEHFKNVMNIRKMKRLKFFETFSNKIDHTDWPNGFHPFYDDIHFDKNRIIASTNYFKIHKTDYHEEVPKFMNYANIGGTIGHELTHGFDNIEDHYEDGLINIWWTETVAEKFVEKEKCFLDQYSKFSMNNITFNATRSWEIISDNGGLRHGYSAFLKKLEKLSDEEKIKEMLPGLEFLTLEKLFFVSYGQSLCGRMPKKPIISNTIYNRYPPGIFRLMGALQNFEEFSKVFECDAGTHMNPVEKCQMW